MLTPEMREKATKLLEDVRGIQPGVSAIEYDLYNYVELCCATRKFLEELLDCRAGGAAHNPMFETGKET